MFYTILRISLLSLIFNVTLAQTKELQLKTFYEYNNEGYPIQISTPLSSGETEFVYHTYISDFPISGCSSATMPSVLGLYYAKSVNFISMPVETIKTIKKSSGIELVVGGELKTLMPNKPYIREIYTLNLDAPINKQSFNFASIMSGTCVLIKHSKYRLKTQYKNYDNFGNPKDILNSITNINTGIFYNKNGIDKSVSVLNCESNQFSYVGFDDIPCNASVSTSVRVLGVAFAGNRSFDLGNGNFILSPDFKTDVDYELTYWSNPIFSTIYVSINGNIIQPIGTGNTIDCGSRGIWRQMKYTISKHQQAPISIYGTGAIDEVRLHPIDAFMTNYTYEIDGIKDVVDERGEVVRQEYDNQGRPTLTRNTAGEILQKKEYKLKKP